MTDYATIVPRVAFVINLAPSDGCRPNPAIAKHLAHLFRGHHLPATWAIADAAQSRLIEGTHEIALALDESHVAASQTAARFGEELDRRISSFTGDISMVVGDAALLRNRLPVLAERGIRAIFAASASAAVSGKPRPLPCGLWLVGSHVRLPKRRRTRWLPTRSPKLADVLAPICDGNILVSISAMEMEQAGKRGMHALENLLREVSRSVSREELRVGTVSEIVADLTARHAGKPQRSILRLAA